MLRPVEKGVARETTWEVGREVGREVVGIERSSDTQQQLYFLSMSNMLYPWECAWHRWILAHEMGTMAP